MAVVDALIASERAGIELPFEKAAAIDLAGRNVLEAVKMSVNPKVIETPNISAVAKDGIAVKIGANTIANKNSRPVTIADKPVRPPAATPAEDST